MAHLTLHVFDVDDGDCLCLITPEHKAMGIDFRNLETLPHHPWNSTRAKANSLSIPPILSGSNFEIDALAPRQSDASQYVNMLMEVQQGKRKKLCNKTINRCSAILRIQFGQHTIILGGDAPKDCWRRVFALKPGAPEDPKPIQVVKAAHHGCNDSFYPRLWDDLFGNRRGIVAVSANGVTRPTREFLSSFRERSQRKIRDRVLCTGKIDPNARPDNFPHELLCVADSVSQLAAGSDIVRSGRITVKIPDDGQIRATQPFATRV